MNKKEQAELESLRIQLSEAKALKYSGMTHPIKLEPPKSFENVVNGWNFNTYNSRVYEAWSRSVSHGEGHVDPKKDKNRYTGGSQNSIYLYATKLDALIGLRLAKEIDYAKSLADLDRLIEKERNL